jgi:hypothetical protein
MGRTTSVSSTSATACCTSINGAPNKINGIYVSDIPTVTCTSDGTGIRVTKILWEFKSLTGSIPASIGKLVNLETL